MVLVCVVWEASVMWCVAASTLKCHRDDKYASRWHPSPGEVENGTAVTSLSAAWFLTAPACRNDMHPQSAVVFSCSYNRTGGGCVRWVSYNCAEFAEWGGLVAVPPRGLLVLAGPG